jgi:PhoPQ-activated pathogenicity-related protein
MQYVPNFGHDLRESDALSNMISFYASVFNTPRPVYNWEIKDDKIIITTDPNQKPTSIKLWSANNSESRDFRIDVWAPNGPHLKFWLMKAGGMRYSYRNLSLATPAIL